MTPFPAVYGTYEPEPMQDTCFARIAAAADNAMIDVLVEDLDPLDVGDDAELVSLDEFYEAEKREFAERQHEADVAALIDAYYADLAA